MLRLPYFPFIDHLAFDTHIHTLRYKPNSTNTFIIVRMEKKVNLIDERKRLFVSTFLSYLRVGCICVYVSLRALMKELSYASPILLD